MLLPDDVDISDRSRKFYDGTYTLTSDGFIDERGVYRDFDCNDPAARAPTPLPPIFPTDQSQQGSSMTTVTTSLVGEDVSYLPARSSVQETNTLGVRTESPAQFKFASESTGGAPITVLQDDLFRGYNDRERLLGKIEGIQIANRQKGTELSQSDCYRLCGVPDPGGCGTDSVSLKQNNTPPSVPGAVEISGSPLSDCPSDLSDWEDDKKAKSTTKTAESKSHDKPRDESPPKRKTRGVAQKVRKTPKRPGTGPAIMSRTQAADGSRRKSASQTRACVSK